MVYRDHPAFQRTDWALMIGGGMVFAGVLPKILPFPCNYVPVMSFITTALTGASLMFGAIGLARGFGAKALFVGLVGAFLAGAAAFLSHICP